MESSAIGNSSQKHNGDSMGKGNGELAPSAQAGRLEIDGVTFRIRGLTSDEMLSIIEQSPGLLAVLSNDATGQNKIILDTLRATRPILEYGCDADADKQAQAVKLPGHEQMKLAEAILRMTYPDETSPFGAVVGVMVKTMNGQISTIEAMADSSTPLSAMSSN